MRFAIMSDIHAYPPGLTRAFEDAKQHKAEAFICLGDYVGYGPDPEGAIKLSHRIFGEQTVMGNHDAALVRQFPAWSFSSRAQKSIDRQREIISKENWKWLKSRRSLVFEEPLLGLHGDIRMEDGRLVPGFGYVFRPEDADRVFAAVSCIPVRVICVGHTHEPAIWRSQTGGPAELLDTDRVEVGPMERYLVNVGSVGCPRSVPYASYAIVEMESGSHRVVIELHKLDFDYRAYRDALLAAQADVPIWLEDMCNQKGSENQAVE